MEAKCSCLLKTVLLFVSSLCFLPLSSAAEEALTLPKDLGTPEGTAAILKAAPSISAGAFTLGMPADEAIAQLKAAGMFNDPFARPQLGFKFNQLPDVSFLAASYGINNRDTSIERVGLSYTMYPSKPVVAMIYRTLNYHPNSAPNVENTLAALDKKYGPESGKGDASNVFWLFDYQGHPLTQSQITDLQKMGCLEAGKSTIAANAQPDTDKLGNKISRGYIETNGGYPADSPCYALTYVRASMEIYKPAASDTNWGERVYVNKPSDWPAIASDLVGTITVYVVDVTLDYSASLVTRDAILNNGSKREQQQRDAAKNNKADL